MLSQQSNSLLYGKPLVKPGSIESELDKIRTATAAQDVAKEQQSTGSAGPRARATLSNLIILNAGAGSSSAASAIDHLINELCLSHPSRFFVVDCNLPETADPAENGIATAVSSRCFLADSGAHVCSEEIYISVAKKSIAIVPNLLVSLLAPDVDVVLVVVGDPGASSEDGKPRAEELLGILLKIVDRVIYDSLSCGTYSRGIRTLTDAAALGAHGGSSSRAFAELARKLSDMNWRRIKRWRSLIAEGFDAERLADSVPSISRITLTCRQPAAELQRGCAGADALLLAGWILHSLEVYPEKNTASSSLSGLTLDCRGKGGAVQLEFAGESGPSLTDARVSAVEILAETADAVARMFVDRNQERGTAEISTGITDKRNDAKTSCEFSARNAPFPAETLDELVLANMVSRREDEQYVSALELSLRIAEIISK
jgi:glucose-6-phosphate dehydrogenase assembly protein OpcA